MKRKEKRERTERFKRKLEKIKRIVDKIEVEENLDMLLGVAEGIEEEEKKQGI